MSSVGSQNKQKGQLIQLAFFLFYFIVGASHEGITTHVVMPFILMGNYLKWLFGYRLKIRLTGMRAHAENFPLEPRLCRNRAALQDHISSGGAE